MLEDDLFDTHLCIKCNTAIEGLNNYINHRKTGCTTKTNLINRGVVQVDHSYGAFDFNVPNTITKEDEVDKSFPFNYDIDTHHQDIQTEDTDTVQRQTDKQTSNNYAYNYGLGADVFFSSLELRSSSKKPENSVVGKQSNRILTRKATAAILAHHDQDDVWINSQGASGSDQLMKAVNDISGTKKDESIFKFNFQNESPDPSDSEVEDDDDDDDAEDVDDSNDDGGDNDDDDYDLINIPPQTGGKWKPEQRPSHRINILHTTSHWDDERENWEMQDDTHEILNDKLDKTIDQDDDDPEHPPPTHTRGKWVPGTKIVKLDYKPEPEPIKMISNEYWCNSCNRRLASKTVFERHLKSNIHRKKSQPEAELEEASNSKYRNRQLSDMQLNVQMPTVKSTNKKKLKSNTSKNGNKTDGKATAAKSGKLIKKRKRRRQFIKCELCKTRLPNNLFGKHLISHYHWRRMFINPELAFRQILENMDQIIHHSPFQCQSCKFYANTEDQFMRHWLSNEHKTATNFPGRYLCQFCNHIENTIDGMKEHLCHNDHQDIVKTINRSVPIVITKLRDIKCYKCNQLFRYNIELMHHMPECDGIGRPIEIELNQFNLFKCQYCNVTLRSRLALQRHEILKHRKWNYYCAICKLSFKTAIDAKLHRRTIKHKVASAHRNNRQNLKKKCKICNETLSDIIELKKHLELEHPNIKHRCPMCGLEFTLSQELSRHIRDKICTTLNKVNDSTICLTIEKPDIEQSLDTDYSLQLPVTSSTITTVKVLVGANNNDVDDDQRDDIIGEIDSTIIKNCVYPSNNTNRDEADNVVKTATAGGTDTGLILTKPDDEDDDDENEEKTWGCELCSYSTKSQAENIFHGVLHMNEQSIDNKMKCPWCDKSFRKSSLLCHLRNHTNERIFQCTECSMSYTRKSNLKDHVKRIHSGTTNSNKKSRNQLMKSSTNQTYQCTYCSKTFSKKHILEQHYHVHRNQLVTKRFRCAFENCSYSGRFAAELRDHLLTHSDEKNFHCTFDGCQYTGKTLNKLKRHMKIHTEPENTVEKIHKCTECSFATSVSSHLKRHVKTHTREKPFKCPHCDYNCTTMDNLRKHIVNTKKHPGRYIHECTFCLNEKQNYGTNFEKDYKNHLLHVHSIIDFKGDIF